MGQSFIERVRELNLSSYRAFESVHTSNHRVLASKSENVFGQPHPGTGSAGGTGVTGRQMPSVHAYRSPIERNPQWFLSQGDALIRRPNLVAWPAGSEWRTRRPCRETIYLQRRNEQ